MHGRLALDADRGKNVVQRRRTVRDVGEAQGGWPPIITLVAPESAQAGILTASSATTGVDTRSRPTRHDAGRIGDPFPYPAGSVAGRASMNQKQPR